MFTSWTVENRILELFEAKHRKQIHSYCLQEMQCLGDAECYMSNNV